MDIRIGSKQNNMPVKRNFLKLWTERNNVLEEIGLVMGRRNIVQFLKRYKLEILNVVWGEDSKKTWIFKFVTDKVITYQAASGNEFVT
jgi:hypothetical protein